MAIWKPLRLILFIVVMFNALTLIVYLRTQEYHLHYRMSKLQSQLDKEATLRRDLTQRMLDLSQQKKLDERRK